MATQNLTRSNGFNKTRKPQIATALLDYTDNIEESADVHELFVLPANTMITKAELYVLTASDAATSATADVGFADDTLIDGANLKSAADSTLSGGTNSVVPIVKPTGGTVTFTPTYAGATSVGKFQLVIEYVELDRTDGDLLQFSATA